MIGAAGCTPNNLGSRAQPGRGKGKVSLVALKFALHTRSRLPANLINPNFSGRVPKKPFYLWRNPYAPAKFCVRTRKYHYVDSATILPSQDGSNQECTCDKTNKARPCARMTTCSRSRVKIKANKQVTSPQSELDQGETQQETAGRLISFLPLLLCIVSFFFTTQNCLCPPFLPVCLLCTYRSRKLFFIPPVAPASVY